MNLHSALARLDGSLAARIRRGISVRGITLRAAEADRAAFTQLLTMLNEAERLDMLPERTTITDRNGQPHDLPTAQVRSLLVEYGLIYQSIWLRKVELENRIKSAASNEERAQVLTTFAPAAD